MWTAMPGIVQSVDFAEMTVEVQLAIKGQVFDENNNVTQVNYPLLLNVPIVFPSAGGFTLTMPVAANDEVLVIFASRCIDSWWQNGGFENLPMEARMHDLSDAFAIIGPRSQKRVIGSISASACQLRTDDGSIYLEISASGVKVQGDLHVAGKVVATGEVTGNSIDLSTHTHSGVVPGGGNSGPPV